MNIKSSIEELQANLIILGCKLGLTTKVALCSMSSIQDSIYKLPLLDTNDIPKDTNTYVNKWHTESNDINIA